MAIFDLLQTDASFNELVKASKSGGRHLITSLTGTARTVYLAGIWHERAVPMVITTDNQFHADQLAEDMAALIGSEHVGIFPSEDTIVAEIAVTSLDTKLARVEALNLLLNDPKAVIITSAAGAQRYLPPVSVFKAATLKIDFEHSYDLKKLSADLVRMGYVRSNGVEQPGEFALRGSIIDIYPLNLDNPVRLDFFDTELDLLRTFDVETQRSLENLPEVEILPASDLVVANDEYAEIKTRLEIAMTTDRDALVGADKRHLTESFHPLLNALDQNMFLPEIRQYLHLVYPDATSIFDYLPEAGLAVFDDFPRAIENSQASLEENIAWWETKATEHQGLKKFDYAWQLTDLARDLRQASIILSPLQRSIGNLKQSSLTNVVVRPAQQFFGQMNLLKGEVARWQKQGMTIIFAVNTAERANRLLETLANYDIKVNQVAVDKLVAGRTQLTELALSAGFELPAQKLVLLTERELFQQVQRKVPRRQTLSNAERLKSYNELKPGDYVVHVNHGIGIYEGMETIENRGIKQDYITIGFLDDAKIFIPVTQLDLVQKYVGSAEKQPKLTKLGSPQWAKAKAKVAKRVADIADELIQLSAQRELQKGYAFGPDDAEIQRFEDAFPYPETPDQLRSADEIKKDMERERPMDRLLVGDVGFGKTEVAFRAAFKAAHEGKQVAILAPTTILAQQHFDSMQSRFEDFGIKTAVISRFQSAKESKVIKEQLKNHEIDIIVGTHRIISKDIVFADLGLVVIDEEQRFGVRHKERLKQLQPNVDVLTLTATPIPRTLNMSMVGLRDLSVIETPPANRYPIQTYVMEQNLAVLGNAIEREMARGGQIYYLHNRVEDIAQVAAMVEQIAPEARVTYVHGQMSEAQLEGVLVDFINGEYDVLVTTTIIETGVDIPNANTLYVENADHMGLAQLYQLRGRVGRSNNIAYAYFTYPGTRTLNEESEKRLTAIRDFTELGSGFKIAMRDLSIRGAGDLLGQQQHGFINAVGYDLYTQMLQEAVAQKKGKGKAKKNDAELDLQVEAFLPESYIANGPQKIDLYQRIRKADSQAEYDEIAEDLQDRFGDLPAAVTRLLLVGRLKSLADQIGIKQIKKDFARNNILLVSFNADSKVTGASLIAALAGRRLKGQIKQSDPLKAELVLQPKMTADDWLTDLLALINQLV
ncbi:transcription-repair coupling factor [Weissella oryzae SG25]|uniref:Transcription-repair-coupling factor n=1 Tax=Weissella oryzae (strain DSM 25784 / JCM 18191 / LMG 30913 / SG25) TaxID=1329250 RepID=A0A069CX36_WEIOS|nr:transcription-repair coupling factor [Weissella oryzae]GAK31758.1 transcription-repair coupling factor [Weissella oryzae SG25]